MSDHDAVLDGLRESLGGVAMRTPVEEIVATGRARRRRRWAGGAAGVAAAAGLAVAVANVGGPPSGAAGEVHVHAAAFTVDSGADGTVRATWDKQAYFTDHAGLQAALRRAGFPVLIKVGRFCKGPRDDGTLNRAGIGKGVSRVMTGVRGADDKVTFVFTPSAMPAGKQLFIGYLTPAQRAANPRLGSVERLVPTGAPLTCTTEPPS